MDINNFCAPALLYVAFSVTQIIIDTFKQMYNTALVKVVVMIIFTYILNILCQRGLGIISWFIVFIPFITMTVITALLLMTFGLHPKSGQQIYPNNKKYNHNKKTQDPSKKTCNKS
jgi:archaellum biogenesis protein FlaJ (TadC family)